MGDVVFATAFADDQMVRRQGIVGTAFVPTSAGVFTLRQRAHRSVLLNIPAKPDK